MCRNYVLHLLCKLGLLLRCTLSADVGVLASPSSEKGHRAAAPATTAVASTATAKVDMIKAEHMRSSSAMPALDSVKLGTKSSFLPNAAAEATQYAATVAATLARSQAATASKLTGQASKSGPSLDAQSKTGANVTTIALRYIMTRKVLGGYLHCVGSLVLSLVSCMQCMLCNCSI